LNTGISGLRVGVASRKGTTRKLHPTRPQVLIASDIQESAYTLFISVSFNPIRLSPFPLGPPLNPPQRPPSHTLIRYIRFRTKLKLVDLQHTKQRARRQRERDLRWACGMRVRIAARERAPERRGADAEGEVPEVVEAEEVRDQRTCFAQARTSTRHWQWCLYSSGPSHRSRDRARRRCPWHVWARGECRLECSCVVLS
jgi:hypothetical protein